MAARPGESDSILGVESLGSETSIFSIGCPLNNHSSCKGLSLIGMVVFGTTVGKGLFGLPGLDWQKFHDTCHKG